MPSMRSQVAPAPSKRAGPLSGLPIPVLEPSAKAYFLNRYKVDENGCWIWQGKPMPNGYGQFMYKKRKLAQHRVSYTIHKGPIPDGLTIDHLCRNRICGNPDHLEAVTNKVNSLRGVSPWAVLARRTHCSKGHEFTPENLTFRADGYRRCKACDRELRKNIYRRKNNVPAENYRTT